MKTKTKLTACCVKNAVEGSKSRSREKVTIAQERDSSGLGKDVAVKMRSLAESTTLANGLY